MGCTPSKNPVSDANGKQLDPADDDSYKICKYPDSNIITAASTNVYHKKHFIHTTENNGKVAPPQEEIDSKSGKQRNTQNPKHESRFTQSQLDFFQMLDRKIDDTLCNKKNLQGAIEDKNPLELLERFYDEIRIKQGEFGPDYAPTVEE